MKRFLSRYSFKYTRALVYMLQASEYNLSEFFAWYKRVKDFGRVETRKHLVKTFKTRLLLGLSAGFIGATLAVILVKGDLFSLIIYFSVLPYVMPYVLTFCALALSLLQKPIEKSIINRAKTKLANHKALKIGIAGSFGKTTMKEILRVVLEQSKKVAATPENKNTPLGISRFVANLEGNEEILIFEMGEYYPGDIKILCELVNPDIGIITGVNEAHLEKFKTIERAADTIFELADFLRNKKETKLYVNSESRLIKEKSASYNNAILYGSFGIESKEGSWKTEGATTDLAGTSFVLKNKKGDGVVVNSCLLGLHQVGPLSVVAYIAKNLGIKTADIELGLKQTKAFEHRLEPKEEMGGVTVIDDSYNGNPDGVRAAINFLKEIKNKRRFYITPGLVEMGAKTEEIHKNIGRQLAEADIEKVVLIRNSVTPFIEAGLKEHNYKGEIIWFEDALTAFATLPKMTISNDLLLYQNDWPDSYS